MVRSDGVSDYVKDTILKANHNRIRQALVETAVCQTMSKIQFWKQITTWWLPVRGLHQVCQTMSKIQFWKQITTGEGDEAFSFLVCQTMSKIQFWKQITTTSRWPSTASLMSKIQFWKQITTSRCRVTDTSWCVRLCQRYNFESKSQLCRNWRTWVARCVRLYQRYNFGTVQNFV